MALNESGVIRRPLDTEVQDSKQQRQNFAAALYKEWPNHAGVSLPPLRGSGDC